MMAFIAFFPVLCMCIGAGVDYSRYVDAKTRTKAAIDSAVLAGARMLAITGDEDAGLAAARNYYNDNVSARMSLIDDTVDFKVVANGTKVQAQGTANLQTTFLNLAGINSLPLITNAGSGFAVAEIRGGGGSDIEVAVMLDVTGSMCDDGQGPCSAGSKLDA